MDKILRRKLEYERKEGTECWKIIHKEELHILYSSANIVIVIKSRKNRQARCVDCMGQVKNTKLHF
jgi:hypothetical protein